MKAAIYNFNDQLDHIAYMLNVRTAGKKYENFIVNAIYTKVGNPDLMPVTQQYVRNPNDPRRYYLLDLYFPQLNYGIEVDEGHHLAEDQRARDEVRAQDIQSAIECEEDRIPIFDHNGNKRSYGEICADIDSIVLKIRDKIRCRGGVKWESNEDRKQSVIAKGRFHVADNVFYSSITEIYNICGGKRTGADKGSNVKRLQRCYYKLNDRYILWVPILAIEDADGTVSNGKMGFENTLSEDHTVLREQADHVVDPLLQVEYKRILFMRMRDVFGQSCIKFIGVFELTGETDENHHLRVYKRVAEEIRISDLMMI